MNEVLQFAKSVWLTVRSNTVFVAFEGAFFGYLGDALEDELKSGHLNFTHDGVKKLVIHSAISAFVAVRLLSRPAPATPTP